MTTMVIDASVILVYLLEEQKSVADKVASLLKKAEQKSIVLLSTSLFPLEVANGLRFSMKDASHAAEILNDFSILPIEIIALNNIQIKKALEIAYELGTTVYDASYHVLAIARNAIYITADKKYFDKAKQLGNIELIGRKN